MPQPRQVRGGKKMSLVAIRAKLAASALVLAGAVAGTGFVSATIWSATQQYLLTFPSYQNTAAGIAAVLVGLSIAFSVFSERAFKKRKYLIATIFGLIVAGLGSFSIHAILSGKSHIATESATKSADSDPLYKSYIEAIASNQKKAADLTEAQTKIQAVLDSEELAHQKALTDCAQAEIKKQNQCESEENTQFAKNKKLRDERVASVKQFAEQIKEADEQGRDAKLSAENRRKELDGRVSEAGQVGAMEVAVSVLPDLVLPLLSFLLSFAANSIMLLLKDLDNCRTKTEQGQNMNRTATERDRTGVAVDKNMGKDARLAALEKVIKDGIYDSGEGIYISLSDATKQSGFYKNRHPVRDLFNRLVNEGYLVYENKRYRYADGVKRKPKIYYVDFKRG